MITITSDKLEFLIPEVRGWALKELQDLAARAQFEIETLESPCSKGNIFKFKSISDFRSLTGFWVLSQELRLSLKKNEKFNSSFVNLFEGKSQDIDLFVKDLFGQNLSSPISQFLIRNFLKKNLKCRDYFEKFLESKELKMSRPKSTIKLSNLLPIFSDLVEEWENKVVPKLMDCGWELTKKRDDIWIVNWPPWYLQDTLPPFSEILGRLIPLDQSSKPIREGKKFFISEVFSKTHTYSFNWWKEIREYLISKGFVECNTSKFIEKFKNLNPRDYCLNYNKKLTLRDNLHYSLVFEVLLKNLNQNRKLYPVFELSFCPWNNCWMLGLSSPIELEESKDVGSFWYGAEKCKEFLNFIVKKFLNSEVKFIAPEKGEYLPQFYGALIYRIVINKEVVGQMIIHRLEQFEIRKKELVSVSIKIPYFS